MCINMHYIFLGLILGWVCWLYTQGTWKMGGVFHYWKCGQDLPLCERNNNYWKCGWSLLLFEMWVEPVTVSNVGSVFPLLEMWVGPVTVGNVGGVGPCWKCGWGMSLLEMWAGPAKVGNLGEKTARSESKSSTHYIQYSTHC